MGRAPKSEPANEANLDPIVGELGDCVGNIVGGVLIGLELGVGDRGPGDNGWAPACIWAIIVSKSSALVGSYALRMTFLHFSSDGPSVNAKASAS